MTHSRSRIRVRRIRVFDAPELVVVVAVCGERECVFVSSSAANDDMLRSLAWKQMAEKEMKSDNA